MSGRREVTAKYQGAIWAADEQKPAATRQQDDTTPESQRSRRFWLRKLSQGETVIAILTVQIIRTEFKRPLHTRGRCEVNSRKLQMVGRQTLTSLSVDTRGRFHQGRGGVRHHTGMCTCVTNPNKSEEWLNVWTFGGGWILDLFPQGTSGCRHLPICWFIYRAETTTIKEELDEMLLIFFFFFTNFSCTSADILKTFRILQLQKTSVWLCNFWKL